MNTYRLEALFKLARKTASQSTHRYKMSAVLFRKNLVIASGCNSVKSHPIGKDVFRHYTLHAELAALLQVRHTIDVKGLDIFVYRQRHDGSFGLALPCACCTILLKQYGIRRIYYTTSEYPFWSVVTVDKLHARVMTELSHADILEFNGKKAKKHVKEN